MKLRKLFTGLLLLTLSLGSCSGAGTPPSDSTSETERKDETSHKPESVTLNTDYTVVYPSRNTAALDAAQIVRDVFSPLSLPIRSDAEEAADREILIGNTNRPETAEAKRRLADGDAIVTVVGEKLVLYATADRHYASLVEYLAQELQGSLTLPADLTVKSTLDTVRTLLSEETVGSASTTVSVTLYGEDQNAEVGILVGNHNGESGVILSGVGNGGIAAVAVASGNFVRPVPVAPLGFHSGNKRIAN